MALVLMDTAANALCLCMMLRLMGRPFKGRKMVWGALFGALAALGIRMVQPGNLISAAFWFPVALVMARMACGTWSLRAASTLFAAAGLLGGTVQALAGAAGSLSLGWLIGAAAACVMTLSAARAKRAACDVTRAHVTVTIHGCSASFEGMVDSGNCLRDYLTRRPVIVFPVAAKAKLGLQNAVLRPIFADTAGGRMMMDCVSAERVDIQSGGQRSCAAACVAFSPGLSPGAPALIPQTLIEQAGSQ